MGCPCKSGVTAPTETFGVSATRELRGLTFSNPATDTGRGNGVLMVDDILSSPLCLFRLCDRARCRLDSRVDLEGKYGAIISLYPNASFAKACRFILNLEAW